MSDTVKHTFTSGTKKGNELGMCNCVTCKAGRSGKKSVEIMRLKRKFKNWKSNKPAKKGAYTD